MKGYRDNNNRSLFSGKFVALLSENIMSGFELSVVPFGGSEPLTSKIHRAEAEPLVAALKSLMGRMEVGERAELFDTLTEGYCPHCLSESLPCYCWRDE
tara:strand:- start:1094 stop:1390 length:297 start_codon:yes stop_codon:yes gene_type:complete